jgi:hypothetical protein
MAGEQNCTVIVRFGCLLCCSGIYVALVGGGLRYFGEINFYIASSSFAAFVLKLLYRILFLHECAAAIESVHFVWIVIVSTVSNPEYVDYDI